MADIFEIAGRIHSTSREEVAAVANEILDTVKNKKQDEINTETYTLVNDINERLSGLSPDQQSALSVAAKATNNETKLGYYVCGTEGNVAAKVISDATGYVLSTGGSIKVKMTNANTVDNATLNINSTGAKPLFYDGKRASANNSWEAGETVEVYYDGTSFYANNVAGGSGSGDGAFDVSAKYPTSGVEGGNTYTLDGALAVLNTNLPASKKKGGMSIKFVQSSDNKYVQYRLMSDTFNTTVANWQGVDNKPTPGSKNLVESGGIASEIDEINESLKGISVVNNVNTSGKTYHFRVSIKAGATVRLSIAANGVLIRTVQTSLMSPLYENSTSGNLVGMVADGTNLTYTATTDVSVLALYVLSTTFLAAGDVTITIKSNEQTIQEQINSINGDIETLGNSINQNTSDIDSIEELIYSELTLTVNYTKNITSGNASFSFPLDTSIKQGQSFKVTLNANGVLSGDSNKYCSLYENSISGHLIGTIKNSGTISSIATTDISKLSLWVNTNAFVAEGNATLVVETIGAIEEKIPEMIRDEVEDELGLLSTLIEDKTYTLGTSENAYIKNINGSKVTGQSMYRLYHFNLVAGDYINFKAAVPTSVAAISIYNGEGKNYTPLVVGRHNTTAYEYNYLCKEDMTVAVCWVNTTLQYINGYHSSIREELYERTPVDVDIVLPNEIVVVSGHQLTIYNDDIVLCDNLDDYDIKWSGIGSLNAKSYSEGLRINADTTGSYNVTLAVRDKFTFDVIKSKSVVIKSISEPTLTGKKVIFIGDSLTHAAVYPAEVEVLSSGGISSVGTRTRSVMYDGANIYTVAHEGRSGWYVGDYLTKASKDGVTNPFYNPSTNEFDFAYYISQNNIDVPDIVCICLGTNGFLENQDNVVSGINTIISSIQAYNTANDVTIKILVSLITPPAEQDGWANSYNHRTYSANEMKSKQLSLVKKYIDAFSGRENIGLIPWYVNIDRKHDFPTTEEALSSRNPKIIVRENDNVHPGHFAERSGYIELVSGYGYLKMADSMYYTLAYYLS